jgi:hypothetical protein
MRSRQWTLALVPVLALALSTAALAGALTSEAVALLVKFHGDVTVERPGAPGALAGEVGMMLNPGDRVLVPAGSEAVVLYRTGRLLKSAAAVTIEDVAAEASSSLFTNTVRTLAQVATTDARTQPNRQGMIRPIAGSPVPVAPRNGVRVLDVRPTFTWMSAPTSDYVIQVHRQGADAPRPLRFSVGADTTWTWPHDEPPLVPGATYVWTVGGEGIGRVAQPQRFTVAAAQDVGAVEAALAALIEAGIDPMSDGLFLTALAYRDAGLFYEADRALARMARDGDGEGRSYFMLRGEVHDALGRIEAAEEAFRRADGAPSS